MLHIMQENVLRSLFPDTPGSFYKKIIRIEYFESVSIKNKTAGVFIFQDEDCFASMPKNLSKEETLQSSMKFKSLYFGDASKELLEAKDLSKAKLASFDDCFDLIGEMECALDCKFEKI